MDSKLTNNQIRIEMASAMFGAMRKTWKSNNMTTGTAGGSRHFSGRDKQMVDSLGGQFNMLLSSLLLLIFPLEGSQRRILVAEVSWLRRIPRSFHGFCEKDGKDRKLRFG